MSARKRPHTGPVVVEITRGRPYNECEHRTDCAGEGKKIKIFEKLLTPTPPSPLFRFAFRGLPVSFSKQCPKSENDLVRS